MYVYILFTILKNNSTLLIVLKNNQKRLGVTVVFSVIDHSSLTCDVDLDLQAAVLGDLHRRPLGDHATLDRFWHDGPGGAGGGRA